MTNISIGLVKGLLLSMLAGSLVGCEALQSLTSVSDSPSNSPTATASPEASASLNPSGSTKAVAGQNVTCDTPNYSGKITWQGEEARMTFGRKPNGADIRETSPVTILSNADSSTTYGYQGEETTVYLRAYPNGSCLLQALDSQGAVTVEEFGRTGFVNSVSVNPVSANPVNSPSSSTIAQPSTNSAPAPAPAIAALSSPASAAEQPIEPSKPAGASLSCAGTIKDSVDFTAYFAPNAGFNRVVFRPRESKVAVVSALSYTGKNPQGQDTWQGKANEVAQVTLVNLSVATPQRGAEIAVDYDGLLGQAICQ